MKLIYLILFIVFLSFQGTAQEKICDNDQRICYLPDNIEGNFFRENDFIFTLRVYTESSNEGQKMVFKNNGQTIETIYKDISREQMKEDENGSYFEYRFDGTECNYEHAATFDFELYLYDFDTKSGSKERNFIFYSNALKAESDEKSFHIFTRLKPYPEKW